MILDAVDRQVGNCSSQAIADPDAEPNRAGHASANDGHVIAVPRCTANRPVGNALGNVEPIGDAAKIVSTSGNVDRFARLEVADRVDELADVIDRDRVSRIGRRKRSGCRSGRYQRA